jgi:hypothetical protein
MDRKAYKIAINSADPGYEPFPVSIMNRSTSEVTTFDPLMGKPATISYRLNKSGCIRIRLVHRKEPKLLIRTLQDWTHQEFGNYELTWDGRDASGNFVDNKKMFVSFEAKDKDKGLQHQDHDEAVCRDPQLILKSSADLSQAVKGTFELVTVYSQKSLVIIGETDCEVRYYVDYKLFKTDLYKKGTSEFNLKMATTILNNGKHLITVNVDDFHDHIGTAGIPFTVEN